MYVEEELPGFPRSLSSTKTTPARFFISPSIPRLGFVFSWIKEDLLSAFCRKLSPWTAPWRGKLNIKKWNKTKSGNKKSLGGKGDVINQFIAVTALQCVVTATLTSFQTSHKNKVSLEGAGGSAPSHSVLGRDVGTENPGWDAQAVGATEICCKTCRRFRLWPEVTSCTCPVTQSTGNLVIFSFLTTGKQRGYQEILVIFCFFSVLNHWTISLK